METEGKFVKIRFDPEIKNLQDGDTVGFIFGGDFPRIFDYTMPVLKVEGQTVTLFFYGDETNNEVLHALPQGLRDGSIRIVRCDPHSVCP